MFHHNRDPTPFEVERDLIDFAVGMNVGMVVLQDGQVERISAAGPIDRLALNGLVERIAHSGFVQAVQVCE